MNPFVRLYRFFSKHKALMYILMVGTALCGGYLSTQLRFEENIATLLPKTEDSSKSGIAFSQIKVKDKVFILIHHKTEDGVEETEISQSGRDSLVSAMDAYIREIEEKDDSLIANCLYRLDEDDIMNMVTFFIGNLPAYLPEEAYPKLDSLLDEKVIDKLVAGEYEGELPTAGGLILKDRHLFSQDGTAVMAFLTPGFDGLDSKSAGRLNRLLIRARKTIEEQYPGVEILFHGNPINGCHNSGQIKKDLLYSVGISLVIICLVILLCFKTKRTLFYLVIPIVYGVLIAMGGMYLIKGSLSIISLGIGAIVLGVAMSYCLHILTHHKYVSDIETLLSEQSKPVCLGCLTTVGAFAGLLLTSSELLTDFGLFASLALLATTFFVLVFLPHFLTKSGAVKNEKAFNVVNRINSYPLDRNKPVVIFFSLLCVVCIFFSRKVTFDSDLNHIGYFDPATIRSERLYEEKVNGGFTSMYYAAVGEDLDSAIYLSRNIARCLSSLQKDGLVDSYSGADMILIPSDEQAINIGQTSVFVGRSVCWKKKTPNMPGVIRPEWISP